MNPPQVYMCSPSWTHLPPPSPYHPSGSSQCTSPKLYKIVSVLPNIKMNPPQVYMWSPSWTMMLKNPETSGWIFEHKQLEVETNFQMSTIFCTLININYLLYTLHSYIQNQGMLKIGLHHAFYKRIRTMHCWQLSFEIFHFRSLLKGGIYICGLSWWLRW